MKQINISISFDLELLDEDFEWLLGTNNKHEIYHLVYDMMKEQSVDAQLSVYEKPSNQKIKRVDDVLPNMIMEYNQFSEL